MKDKIMKMNNLSAELSRSRHTISDWIRHLLEVAFDGHGRRAEKRAIKRAIRELSQLDDHILKDMGLSRNTIGSAVRERAEAERRGRFGW